MAAPRPARRRLLDRGRDHVAELDVLRCSSILPRVIRETSSRSSTRRDEVADLALDHARARSRSDGSPRSRISCSAVTIGDKRVAQLVTEHREELVLCAVRPVGGIVDTCTIESGRDLLRDVMGERAVGGVARVARRQREREDPDLLAAHAQRQQHHEIGRARRRRGERAGDEVAPVRVLLDVDADLGRVQALAAFGGDDADDLGRGHDLAEPAHHALQRHQVLARGLELVAPARLARQRALQLIALGVHADVFASPSHTPRRARRNRAKRLDAPASANAPSE